VNSASYCEVLLKLRDAIRTKRPGQLAWGVLLHHDNVRMHASRATQERVQELQWELLEHPPYSPDMVPSDIHLFGPIETTLVAHFSLIAKRLKRSCGSGWNNSQKTSVLRASTHWWSDGTSISMLVEDMSRNARYFQVRISHVLHFISLCDIFTDFPLYWESLILDHIFGWWLSR
jgi:hypothetical protein